MRGRRRAAARAMLLLAAAAANPACAPMQTYDGDRLDADEVCQVRVPSSDPHLALLEVDGIRARAPAEVLPGRRELRILLADEGVEGYGFQGACRVTFDARPGAVVDVRGRLRTQLKDVPVMPGGIGRMAQIEVWVEEGSERIANCGPFERYVR